ncbi:unnamed protein product [Didymodactylos carnosus]|uniref:HORMA domain-containing protein n=1 Tax=Didymodactylos carnosus TaxID=1234261 RepID=A0A813QAS1_9BILA|nr:unnamed protein product [Didymodactylos carnosus]CAF1411007.1 unnamed protein product [Didymodactylos carnosus]CAF3545626.1 unnamed protein product [Didymodactylos carnosus]CAF4215073.1 unnamed protein product [Didymodactylos carnosus]
MRLLEKQLREEVLNRCLEFLDVTINFILYSEYIYPSELFERRQKYGLILYECVDEDVQQYISLCVESAKTFLQYQLLDMISVAIIRTNDDENTEFILRRYLIELHPLIDPCLRSIHTNIDSIVKELDTSFRSCLIEIMKQKPIHSQLLEQITWKFQMRSCSQSKNASLTSTSASFEHILNNEHLFREFLLLNVNNQLETNSELCKITPVKSIRTQRLTVQLMCENNLHQQNKFKEYLQSIAENEGNETIQRKIRLSSRTSSISQKSITGTNLGQKTQNQNVSIDQNTTTTATLAPIFEEENSSSMAPSNSKIQISTSPDVIESSIKIRSDDNIHPSPFVYQRKSNTFFPSLSTHITSQNAQQAQITSEKPLKDQRDDSDLDVVSASSDDETTIYDFNGGQPLTTINKDDGQAQEEEELDIILSSPDVIPSSLQSNIELELIDDKDAFQSSSSEDGTDNDDRDVILLDDDD